MATKSTPLRELALLRQRSGCDGHTRLGDYRNGAYECDFVSPYTKSAGNVDAEVMILLQDWCSHEYIAGGLSPDVQRLGYDPTKPTNINLITLLRAHLAMELAETYATNLFPFIKPGAMGSRIPQRDLDRAALEFALPQVRIVQPLLVVCLGLQTFNAMRRACGQKRVARIAQGIEQPFECHGAMIWCQAHAGQMGRNNRNRGGVDRVSSDWQAMALAQ